MNIYKPACIAIMETKCPAANASNIFTKIGYRDTLIQEGQGRGGGIWFAWRPNLVNIIGHSLHQNFIKLEIETNYKKWCLSIVYACPQPTTRLQNWVDLAATNRALIGDFNDILDYSSEKRGGAPWDPNCGRAFNDWINSQNLMDVTAEGPRFTWVGPVIGNYDRVLERLDRLLCKVAWRQEFEDATVSVLPRHYSDHHPLLLQLDGLGNAGGDRPFRFETSWFTHEKFREFVSNNWNNKLIGVIT